MMGTDSLVIGGVIELLGGGVASVVPQAAGALFRLGTGFDMSAPQLTTSQVEGLLLDGSVVTGVKAENRTPTIPVVICVPSTGNQQADRATLAGARELLLQTVSQDNWELIWTRDGAQPLIFDCMSLATVVVHYSIMIEQNLFSQVDIAFAAFPYGRSDTQESVLFNSPAQQFSAPPAPVTIDDFSVASSFLTGDASTFEAGIANWNPAGNCTVARSTAQAHTGTASLAMTSVAAGAMQSASFQSANIADGVGTTGQGLKCNPGDTITVRGFSRAATVARSVNVGADFYDSSGTVVGSTLRGSNVTNSTSVFTVQATATVTAPAGAAYCRATPQVLAAAAAGEVHYWDDVTLDRGPVASTNDPYQWSRSATAAFGSFSAKWSRKWHDFPVYDHVMPAALDITGRSKWGFWFGLGTSSSQWPVWHRGTVSFAVTLYDASGASMSFGFKRTCHASALENSPHWQFVTASIPQMASGFDYTTVSRYVISAWSQNQPIVNPDTGKFGQQVLQSGAYFNLIQALASTNGTPGTRGGWYYLPGVVGTARSAIAIQAAPGPSGFSTVTDFTVTGSNNWTAPAGVTHVDKAETWAGGAGGAGSNGSNGGGGGGGGEWAMELNVPVTPTTVYHPFVGAGGAHGAGGGNQGANGGDSTFAGDSGPTVRAHGGRGGWQSTVWGGGKGGTGSNNYGHSDGGNGEQANAALEDHGGGGGSSGGPSSGGRNAGDIGNGRPGAPAVSGGGPGGDGGFAGTPPETGQAPSVFPGGGGGGGSSDGSGQAGGDGKPGRVRLTYGATGLLPLQSLLVHAPPRDAPDLFNPLCPVGNGADTPNGATEYLIPDLGNLNARYDGTYTMYLVASTFSAPSSSRDLTVQLRQYPYSGGTAITLNVPRKGLVPSSDLLGTQTYVDMGPVTLPLADLPPGSLSPYFALTVNSTLTADRFLDVILIDTAGSFVLVNVGASSVFNNIWLDPPDATRDLGRILGSNADRDQAVSALQYAERFSGGPIAVYPDSNNRLFVYSGQGAPGITGYYPGQWWTERLA
jgi:hypothetical protein